MTPMTKEQAALEFVENFVKYGFRIDTNPTRLFLAHPDQREGQFHEYGWWTEYVTNAERRLMNEAEKILNIQTTT